MFDHMKSYRKLPLLMSREEMLDTLFREEYGYMPPEPDRVTWNVGEKPLVNRFCAGKATLYRVEITADLGAKSFTFPIYATLPTKQGKHPFFVHINFRDDVPDRYMPSEELIDNGFAVLSFCYEDVTSDDNDFTNGLAGVLYENGKRGPTDAGKLAMWAWAAQRVLDYAQTLDCLDMSHAIVCGHSRLGKTALLAAATDTRFRYAHSNDSGCSGAAISRCKDGESVEVICRVFPFWFCENYQQYANKENEMPFDQHFLIASIAPRYVSVGSAVEDVWADPVSEMLGCVAASPAWENGGFVFKDKLPTPPDTYLDGAVGYYVREGTHYFSREDWHKLIEFVHKHP